MTAAAALPVAGAVVADDELDGAVVVAHDDLRVLRVRVLDRVRQALLHESIGRQVDPRRQHGRRPLEQQLRVEPRLARLRDELVDVLEARLWDEGRRLLRSPQHADEPAHLGQRGPARLLDGLQRLALALLVLTEESAHGGRLNRHDADGVADDVVQLARDTCALLGNGGARLYLSFQLESLGALAQLFRLT